jgi:acyl carrier protein
MPDDITQRVLKTIAGSKKIPVEKVTIDGEFAELGIDSMDAVEILFALENEFDISIPDDDVRNVRNVRQMVDGVEKLVAAKAAGPAASGPVPPAPSAPEA